ncbi:MAG: hypothetical protein OQK24_10335 [Magnetovibrio sp.]|nr:hypothetical protein [Magnetovibrio sp.]
MGEISIILRGLLELVSSRTPMELVQNSLAISVSFIALVVSVGLGVGLYRVIRTLVSNIIGNIDEQYGRHEEERLNQKRKDKESDRNFRLLMAGKVANPLSVESEGTTSKHAESKTGSELNTQELLKKLALYKEQVDYLVRVYKGRKGADCNMRHQSPQGSAADILRGIHARNEKNKPLNGPGDLN